MLFSRLTCSRRHAVDATGWARASQRAAVSRSTQSAQRCCTTARAVLVTARAARSCRRGGATRIGGCSTRVRAAAPSGNRSAGARCELFPLCSRPCAMPPTPPSPWSVAAAPKRLRVAFKQASCLQRSERCAFRPQWGVDRAGHQRQLLCRRCGTEKVTIASATGSRGTRQLCTSDRRDRTALRSGPGGLILW